MAITRLNNNSLTSITALPSAVAVANTPAWRAQIASQSLPFNTATKIDYTSELQDTNTAYDTSNKRFTVPSGLGGTYMVGAWFRVGSGTDVEAFNIYVYKNGSFLSSNREIQANSANHNYNIIQTSATVQLSASDYLEMYAFNNQSNATYTIGYDNAGLFWGYKIIT